MADRSQASCSAEKPTKVVSVAPLHASTVRHRMRLVREAMGTMLVSEVWAGKGDRYREAPPPFGELERPPLVCQRIRYIAMLLGEVPVPSAHLAPWNDTWHHKDRATHIMPTPLDLTTFLLSDRPSTDFHVLGVRIGDPGSKLLQLPATSFRAVVEGMSFVHSSEDGVSRVEADGTRTPMTTQQGCELVAAHSGDIRVGDTIFGVTDGVVTRIRMRDDALPGSSPSEAVVRSHLGQPDVLDRAYGTKTLFYVSRGISIGWRGQVLDNVLLARDATPRPIERHEVRFVDGYVGRIERLVQDRVYAGLLQGLPTKQRNDQRIQRTVELAKKSDRVYLVPPVQTPIERERRYPFGTPASLPSIECVATFEGGPVKGSDGSCLIVIWYQDSLALPLEPQIREHLEQVRWEEHARPCEF